MCFILTKSLTSAYKHSSPAVQHEGFLKPFFFLNDGIFMLLMLDNAVSDSLRLFVAETSLSSQNSVEHNSSMTFIYNQGP